MSEPLFCFVDDIRFDVLGTGALDSERAYGCACYIVSETGLRSVIQSIERTKEGFGLDAADPVQRAMDDEVLRHYVRRYGGKKAAVMFELAKDNRWAVARAGMDALVAAEGKVFACLMWPFSATPSNDDLVSWGFTNLLDRIALTLRLASRSTGFSMYVVVDRPSDGLLVPYDEVMREPRTYRASLGDRGLFSTLLTGATPHSSALQLADFVSSACRDFLSWCHSNKKKKDAKRFLRLEPILGRKPDGTTHNVGIKVQPYPGFRIDEKLAELAKA